MIVHLARWSLTMVPLFALTVIGAHLLVSSTQTFLQYGLGHHRRGLALFRSHIKFHHGFYARGHLISSATQPGDGNNTPFFLLPATMIAGLLYAVLPFAFLSLQWHRSAYLSMRTCISTTHTMPPTHGFPGSLGSGTNSNFISSIIFTPAVACRNRLFLGQAAWNLPASGWGRVADALRGGGPVDHVAALQSVSGSLMAGHLLSDAAC